MVAVRSKSRVEIRDRTPFRHADNLKGLLFKGFNIEVFETVEGELVNGNKIWYKDYAGNFYWSGGFDKDPGSPLIGSDARKPAILSDFGTFIRSSYNDIKRNINTSINYNDLLEAQPEVKLNKGDGIKVGIMDHPIADTDNLFLNPVERLWSGEKVLDRHGTFMAGLIAGYRSDQNLFEGVSSKCSLVSLPLYVNGFLLKGKDLIMNLKSFSEKYKNDRLVINISHSWRDPEKELREFFEEFAEKHLLIASAGEDKELSEDETIQWPASLDNVIAVGSISKEYFDENMNIIISSKVDIIVPNYSFVSYTNSLSTPFSEARGDSCATAITTGLITLLLTGYDKEKINKENILTDLLERKVFRDLNIDAFTRLNLIIPEK